MPYYYSLNCDKKNYYNIYKKKLLKNNIFTGNVEKYYLISLFTEWNLKKN